MDNDLAFALQPPWLVCSLGAFSKLSPHARKTKVFRLNHGEASRGNEANQLTGILNGSTTISIVALRIPDCIHTVRLLYTGERAGGPRRDVRTLNWTPGYNRGP